MTERAGQPHDAPELIAIGRSCVDLYGEQVGGRLEDMASFAKYVGGSPTNTAIGAARLGLRAALVTRVGADHMGRFIREQLKRERVDTRAIVDDTARLTALVLLGIRDQDRFPLLFYRVDCADMALCEEDLDLDWIATADAVLLSGTHLSQPGVAAASLAAARCARAAGRRVVFDIDYRPVLWGLTAPDRGEDRFVVAEAVTRTMHAVLPYADLIVGTEEEVHLLGGATDTIAALRTIRAGSDATIVCKRGADGCVAFDGAIPDTVDGGLCVPGFPIDLFNALGAGDAFMAGLLRGWLRGETLATACRWGNACGALVASRHGCAPAMPSWAELCSFLARDDWPSRLRDSASLEQLHWTSTRGASPASLAVLAIDHRSQFDDLVADMPAPARTRIPAFKALVVRAVDRLAAGDPGFGLLIDDRFGARSLEAVADMPYWIGRPIEVPGSRPLQFEGHADVAATLRDWPVTQVVKCLLRAHPDDAPPLARAQDAQLLRLFDACRATRHELLLELIVSPYGAMEDTATARMLDHIYALGVCPDWWKLEPSRDTAAWRATERVIRRCDPGCRGILLLGQSTAPDQLLQGFAAAATSPLVKGFAVGRAIWHDVAVEWLTGGMNDERAIDVLSANLLSLVTAWRDARARA